VIIELFLLAIMAAALLKICRNWRFLKGCITIYIKFALKVTALSANFM